MPRGKKNPSANLTYLRFLIKKKKLKVNDIAEELGIAPNQLSDMLHGRKTFSLKRLKIVAEMIGISHTVLFDSVGVLLTKKVEADIIDLSMMQDRGDVRELDQYVALAERLGLITPADDLDDEPGEAENQDADLLEEGDIPDAYLDGEKS